MRLLIPIFLVLFLFFLLRSVLQGLLASTEKAKLDAETAATKQRRETRKDGKRPGLWHLRGCRDFNSRRFSWRDQAFLLPGVFE